MTSKPETFEPWAFAALRIVAGGMLVFHGAQKLFGVLGMARLPAFSQLWFGGVIEFVGGALVAICFVFLFISAHGPGRLSLDAQRGARQDLLNSFASWLIVRPDGSALRRSAAMSSIDPCESDTPVVEPTVA
jgi:uncharacterized membrane protein YphA (DoxX/SURF4 family)